MRAVAVTCFFLSGASGLIFEVIWSRLFSLVFGATTLAISTVLTAFMGGLALGSYLAGRIADRLRDPLRAYALAEAGIGAAALLLPLVVGTFDAVNQFLYRSFSDNYIVLAGARFVISSAVMVVPTTLMGATLPLLSRYFVQSQAEQSRVGLRVGTLYAINTFGAVMGTFLGGFVLLPLLGQEATNTLAACTNITLALVVLVAYRVRSRMPPPPAVDSEVEQILEQVDAAPPPPEVDRRARRVALCAFGVSGAVAMVYQVIWTRALFVNIGSSVYSFTIVLVAFLIGLAGGAATFGRFAQRSKNPLGMLALFHVAIAVLVGVSHLLIDQLPFVFLYLLRGEQLSSRLILWSQFHMALLTMLPATFAMGGILPITVRIYASGLERVGKDVGSAYSINTIGAIVGSFLAGFVVIPVLQLQPGMYLAACTNLLLALVLGSFSSWRRSFKIALAPSVVAIAVIGALLPSWKLLHFTAGIFRPALARDVLKTGKWEDPKLVYYRDGISTTVSVEQWSAEHFSLKNNGKVDASTGDDMPTQITVGLLPVLVHPRVPEIRPEVLLIGYASGVTAGSILQYPVHRLDVVELEPAILEAAKYFRHVNNRPRSDRRLRLITDDGRNFLAAGTARYDVIINEPSNPWITGVSNLFTREYFEIGRRRLKPGGIFCTWAQMYEISPRHIKSIYSTFSSVFPHVYAFSAEALSSDTFLIGAMRPLKMDLRRMRGAFAFPAVKREFGRANIRTPDDLIALTLLGPEEVRSYAVGARVNTDDNAHIEFGAPLDLFNHRLYDYYVSKVYGQSWLYGRLDGFISGYRTSEDSAGLVYSLLRTGKFREATHFEERVDGQAGPRSLLVHRLMGLLGSRDVTEEEVDLAEGVAGPLQPPRAPKGTKPELANRVAREYFMVEERIRRKAYRSALDLVETWPDDYLEGAGKDFHLLWGYLVYKCKDFHTAVKILEPLYDDPGIVKRRPALLYYVGRAFYGNADFAKAVDALEAWIEHRVRAHKPPVPPRGDEEDSGGSTIDVLPG
jgi:spermidine synthase